MRNRWIDAVAVMVLVAGSAEVGAQSVSDLLEKALYQERTAGDLDAAIKIYEGIIKQEDASRPAVAQAYYRLGVCQAKKGENEKAAEAFQNLLKNCSDQKTLVSAARKELDKLAATGGQATAATQPTTRPAVKPGQNRHLLDKETRDAVEHFDRSFGSWFRTDPAYLTGSETERAAMVEKWMAEARSRDFDRRTRAVAALGNVRAEEAIHVLLQIVDEPMGNQRPKWMAVRALGRIGDPVAVPAFIELVDYGNKNVQVYARAGLADITGVYFAGDKAKWRQWWKERGARTSPAHKQEAAKLAAQASAACNNKDYEGAERLFQQALARDPGEADLWNGLGWAQLNQGRPLAAKISFQKALGLDSRHANALSGMGAVAKEQNNADEAIGYWKQAVEAQPATTAALAGLARAHLEQKKYDEAARYFEMWLKADPGSEEARTGLEQARAGGRR